MSVTIRCVRPPIEAAGVHLSKIGETVTMTELSHFWLGQLARGAIQVIEEDLPTPELTVEEIPPEAPLEVEIVPAEAGPIPASAPINRRGKGRRSKRGKVQ